MRTARDGWSRGTPPEALDHSPPPLRARQRERTALTHHRRAGPGPVGSPRRRACAGPARAPASREPWHSRTSSATPPGEQRGKPPIPERRTRTLRRPIRVRPSTRSTVQMTIPPSGHRASRWSRPRLNPHATGHARAMEPTPRTSSPRVREVSCAEAAVKRATSDTVTRSAGTTSHHRVRRPRVQGRSGPSGTAGM